MPVEYHGCLRLRAEVCAHEGRVYVEQTQPSERLVLEHCQELRRNPDALRKLSFGQCELIIPEVVMEGLRRRHPELGPEADSETRTRWWQAFARSTDSLPYRVR